MKRVAKKNRGVVLVDNPARLAFQLPGNKTLSEFNGSGIWGECSDNSHCYANGDGNTGDRNATMRKVILLDITCNINELCAIEGSKNFNTLEKDCVSKAGMNKVN